MKKVQCFLLIGLSSLLLCVSCMSARPMQPKPDVNSVSADKANNMMNSSYDRLNHDGFFDANDKN